ncbi:MAG: hypothetical protein WBG43_04165 [Marinifilaceae bacterium]
MKKMIFKSKLWSKLLGVMLLMMFTSSLFAAITSWHIDTNRELYYLYGMTTIFFIVGVYQTLDAFRYRLIITEDEVIEINAFRKVKIIKLNDVLKIVVFRHTQRLSIVSKNEVIIVKDNLRYYFTFFRELKHSCSHDKFFFFKNSKLS